MTAVLSELLPQTPLGARTRKAKSSKTSRAVEEEAVPLIRDQMGSPHLRQDNVRDTMRVSARLRPRASNPSGIGDKVARWHGMMLSRSDMGLWTGG